MNIDNINRVIEAVRNEPTHFVMKEWNTADNGSRLEESRLTLTRNNPCNTAGCLGGWMDSLALADIADGKMEPPNPRPYEVAVYPTDMAAAFVGVQMGDHELNALFHMDDRYCLSRFDRLPAEKRAEAGVRVLEIFRDTEESDWTLALKETGLLDYMSGSPLTIGDQTYR
jgi:hypothetical protein